MKLFYKNDFACGSSPDPFVLYDNGTFYLYYTGGRKLTAKRSPDLITWEDAGTIFTPEEGSFIVQHLWAPEVIKWKDGRYYLYVTASGNTDSACPEGMTVDGRSGTQVFRPVVDGVTCVVLVGDSPVGPFKQWVGKRPNIVRYYHGSPVGKGDELKVDSYPVFDFPNAPAGWATNEAIYEHNGTNVFSVLDGHPYVDDDGTLYLYFVRSHDSNRATHSVWGMKMLDPVTPDYETMVKLTEPMELYPGGPSSPNNYMDGKLNEGVFVVKKGGKYVMFYCGGDGYNTSIALGDTPLGRFTKLHPKHRNPVLRISPEFGFYDSPEGWGVFGAGHGMVLHAGEEDFFVSLTTRPNPNGKGTVRTTMIDRMQWKYNDILGVDLPVINGPTAYTLQPAPEVVTGYKDIAPLARVTVNGEETPLITDGVIPILKRDDSHTYFCGNEGATVTLDFSEPAEVAAVMVYNSRIPAYAFKKADEILIEGEGEAKRITDVPFPREYLIGDPDKERMRDEEALQKAETWAASPLTDGGLLPGGALVAECEHCGVRKITVKITEKLADNDLGIGISEIVVLGKTNTEA